VRLATIVDAGRHRVVVVRGERILVLGTGDPALASMRDIAAAGAPGLERIRAWVETQPDAAYRSLDGVTLAPVVPDPGAIYTIGRNYPSGDASDPTRADRPMVLGKLPTAVTGHGAVVSWDRSLTANVDAEVELGVVIGEPASGVSAETALRHVLGYTCINDMNSTDPWFDGNGWLLGKSMAGFCPVGPWLVTPDELDPTDLRVGCSIDGVPIQAGRTGQMRHSIADVISYISRHVTLRPGDLIATGTPGRLAGPLGPERRLQPGDEVTVWIERIGDLMITIA
jgi:2-keto-4-pentenoate hydratase/2-oxohepta-3-ene-1,7-dioic acid hydratase in catechol pathway